MAIDTPLILQTLGDLRLHGPDGDLLPHRRKELALLVVLATRAPKPVRREELQARFWGERDEQRARHSLRQALLRVRRACGDDVVIATPDTLRLTESRIVTDVQRFSDAAARGRWREAAGLWAGDFMPGCEDVGGEEFRHWLEAERPRLRNVLRTCFAGVVRDHEARGEWSIVAEWSERWTEQFPGDEAAAEALVGALCRHGDVNGAVAARAAFVRRLAQDLDDEPSAEWSRRIEELIVDARSRPAPPAMASIPSPAEPASFVGAASPTTPSRTLRRGRRALGIALLAGVVLLLAAWRFDWFGRPAPSARLAVGYVETLGFPDSAKALPSLLSINLSRVRGLAMMSEARIQEVRVQLGSRGDEAAALQRAARAAGADEIIEGVLARRPNGRLRLDLRRVDLARGTSRTAYAVEGADLYEVADAAAARIARDFGVELTTANAGGSSRSLAASRLYEEGLRAYYGGEATAAGRMFHAALADDSTFAMAAYFAARATGGPGANALLQRARRLSRHGSDRDRLIIESHWLGSRDEPTQLAVAETLAIRYPAEPAAHFEYARALVRGGRFLEAVPYFRRVVEMDSLGLNGARALCLACDAYRGELDAYRLADSLPAAARVGREWTRRQPRFATAWYSLAGVLFSDGKVDEALDATASASRVDPARSIAIHGLMDPWLRAGDFESIERYRLGLLANPSPESQTSALSAHVYSLRYRGRFAEALPLARRSRLITMSSESRHGDVYPLATVLFEVGRFRESAALFDSISSPDPNDSRARQGRNRAWFLSHAATAVASLGDTAWLRRLEDSVRVSGALSGFRRDQLLHHYVRGLRLRLAGRTSDAIDAFRQSLFSPVEGNTRASLELGRTLLDGGRPTEAVDILRSARRGPIGASGQYVNRTELEILLARGFDGAGQRDSAAAHYAWVLKAWTNPDPSLRAQRDAIQRRAREIASR